MYQAKLEKAIRCPLEYGLDVFEASQRIDYRTVRKCDYTAGKMD